MKAHTRRFALGAGVAALAATATLNRRSPIEAATPPAQLLKVVVKLNRATYEFREEQGDQLGDFVSTIGGFTQGCVRAKSAGCPITVFFRPDRNSERFEVVFELGAMFSESPAHLGAYTATILRGENVVATIDVPKHYWHSRWRWQSAARPIVGNIDTLIQQNLLPAYDREAGLAGVPLKASPSAALAAISCPAPQAPVPGEPVPPPGAPAFYSVMGLAGLFPETGERLDVGPVTGAQAEYICTLRETALALMRAQAEAAGTMPWHMRDENTGTPFDLRKYPDATWYPFTSEGKPYVRTITSAVEITSAHQPALAYVPYLLTGDPYHLEDLQFQATWNLGAVTPEYRFNMPQPSALAWNLRTIAQCAKVTPSSVPSWLQPQQYWTEFLRDYRVFFEAEYVNSPRPERIRFRTTRNIDESRDEGAEAPGGTWIDPWADDLVALVLGWMVAMGFSDWQRAFDWKIGSTVARTSRSAGWRRAHATPYRLIVRASNEAPVAADWAAAWALEERIAKLEYTDANTWADNDMTYLTYTRGVLVYIDRLKAWDVTENLAWATGQLNAKNWDTDYRWQLGKGLIRS
jgi:hypothetical protein